MLSKTKILFLNINGFKQGHLTTYKHLLNTNTYDLIILQETWFAHYSNWKLDPYLFQTSLYPTKVPLTGHIKGGVAIFGHPSRRPLFTTIQMTELSITCSFNGRTMTTSYYAPSRTASEIEYDVQLLPKSSLWIGDFNYRMG